MSHPFLHFCTITRHRHAVFALCARAGIPWRGLLHDLSKYSLTEFLPGARYYTGTASPNLGERDTLGCSRAWMHHKGRNRHHFEYWTDYVPGRGGLVGCEMPPVYFAEMVCDRIAASKIYRGSSYTNADALDYFERMQEHYLMHDETRRRLHTVLTLLRDKGEDAVFGYLREYRNTKQN